MSDLDKMTWCGACQDNFPEPHYDDAGAHKAGDQYGPTGKRMALERDLRTLLPEVAEALDEDGHQVLASRVHQLWKRL